MAPPDLPWRALVRLALAGTLVMVALVWFDVERRDGGNPVSLIQPGEDGPSVAVIKQDFPEVGLPDGLGHDGQQFYAVARQPMHLDALEPVLDRPRYRLQRPLYPWLGWLVAPTGGGRGLILSLFVWGAIGVFGLGLAGGVLSIHLGGGAWPGVLLPLLPGCYAALRISVADTLSLALMVAALALAERQKTWPAAACAVAAVLAKESILVVAIGHALARRTRASVVAAASAAATVVGWAAALRLLVDAEGDQVLEFTWPFGGVVDSADQWLDGTEWIAGVTVVATFALAAVALARRGPRHHLFGALAAATLFSVFLGPDVLGLDFNGPRTMLPVLVLAILTLGTPPPEVSARATSVGSHAPPPCG